MLWGLLGIQYTRGVFEENRLVRLTKASDLDREVNAGPSDGRDRR